jgi:hypothetical protein
MMVYTFILLFLLLKFPSLNLQALSFKLFALAINYGTWNVPKDLGPHVYQLVYGTQRVPCQYQCTEISEKRNKDNFFKILAKFVIFFKIENNGLTNLSSVGPDPKGLLDECFQILKIGNGFWCGWRGQGQLAAHFLLNTWSPRGPMYTV